MGELITVKDFELEILNVVPGSITQFGDPERVEIEASKAKAENKKILVDKVNFIFSVSSPCVFPGNTFVSGAGLIVSTSLQVKCDNLKVLRENDTGVCVGAFTSPSGSPIPCSCNLKIKTAGQTSAKAV